MAFYHQHMVKVSLTYWMFLFACAIPILIEYLFFFIIRIFKNSALARKSWKKLIKFEI